MAKNPKLSVSTAVSKANTTAARLDALVPNVSSDLSPTLIYLPGADVEVAKPGDSLTSADYGWVCPDGVDEGQVECYGPGGGGGGGGVTGVGGGGGGAGGEYACEPNYPLIPGETYSYFAAPGGKGGKSSATGATSVPGITGLSTQFDFRGKGIDGGVLAHGGQGGDQNGPGLGGRGGTGSVNTVHFDGGDGGTSSSGIMSDNPVFGLTAGLNHSALWYRLDEAAGKTVAQDYSQFQYQSAGLVKNTSGTIVAPTSEVKAPLQVPFGASQNWWGDDVPGETQGNCWKFDHGTSSGFIGGIVARSFTLAGITGFTVSAWVRGLSTASGAGDWTDGTHTSCVIATNKNLSQVTDKGWCLYLNVDSSGNPLINFTGVQSNGTVATMTGPGPSANDGNWHMVTATYTPASNHFILYVDGVAVTTTTAGISSIAAGTQPISVGYNKATNSFGFKGYLSNVWVESQEAPASYLATAFGSVNATGGSGGGASGGSAGTGNNGATASGATGGAGGAAAAATQPGVNNGSGAGGAGGNSGSNGTAGAHSVPYAGGGGGAGAKTTVSSAFSVTLPCSMSASYAGLDAQGANAGALYTVSADPTASESNPWYSTSAKQDAICYSGGAADSPFKGSMNSLLTFPSLAAVNGSGTALKDYLNSGDWALQKAYLQLTVETTAACNLVIGLWQSNAVISALDSDTTLTSFGYGGAMQVVHVDAGVAGRQVTIDVSTTALLTALVNLAQSNGYSLNGSALAGVGLLVGTLQGSPTLAGNVHGAWNADEAPDWYCAFHGADAGNPSLSAQLVLSYTISSPSLNTAGDGAPGYIVISFIDPKGTPVATVLPAATTDASGNQLGAGHTGFAQNYNVFDPSTSPPNLALETWHKPSLTLAGWSNQSGGTNVQYKLLPGNMLCITGEITAAAGTAGGVLFTLPAAWRPSKQHFIPFWVNTGTATNSHCVIAPNGQVTVTAASGSATDTLYWLNGTIPLDAI